MAHAAHIEQSFGSSLWQSLSTGLTTTLAQRLAQRRAYRATCEELSALSDRDLADIGLYRADIEDIARRAALEA
jgi:uncharacterized protein YjiS (DUF1127 family)